MDPNSTKIKTETNRSSRFLETSDKITHDGKEDTVMTVQDSPIMKWAKHSAYTAYIHVFP